MSSTSLKVLAKLHKMPADQCMKQAIIIICDVCVNGYLPCTITIKGRSMNLLVHPTVLALIMDLLVTNSVDILAPFFSTDSEFDKRMMKVLFGPPKLATGDIARAQQNIAYQKMLAVTKCLQQVKAAEGVVSSLAVDGEI